MLQVQASELWILPSSAKLQEYTESKSILLRLRQGPISFPNERAIKGVNRRDKLYERAFFGKPEWLFSHILSVTVCDKGAFTGFRKVVKGAEKQWMEKVDKERFFFLSHYTKTCGHQVKLNFAGFRPHKRKYFLTQLITELWNFLSTIRSIISLTASYGESQLGEALLHSGHTFRLPKVDHHKNRMLY